VTGLKLGWSMGSWIGGPALDEADRVARAETLGYDSLWWAEAYGSDALTPLAWRGAATSRARLGTSIVQTAARTPTAVAMAAMTLDHLSHGRFVLGLGVSGPQIVEGWYGVPFQRPLERLREFVSVVRSVIAREDELWFSGEHYHLPARDGRGLGKPLRSLIRPYRKRIPVLLAGQGPRSIRLAAEIGDGWLPFLMSPQDERWRDCLDDGFAARGGCPEDFEIAASVPVVVDDDVERAASSVRAMLAHYIGAMGAPGENFHYDAVVRLGFGSVAEAVRNAYLSRDRESAARRIPLELVDQLALVGPPARIANGLRPWVDSDVKTLIALGGSREQELLPRLLTDTL
jgi:F420-dependent oxidoreductase-like protein